MGSTVWEVNGYKPLSAVFELLKDNDQVAFLDSSEQGEQGRFSIVGCKPFLTIEQVDGRCLVNGVPADAVFFDVLDAALRTHHRQYRLCCAHHAPEIDLQLALGFLH